MAKNFLDIFIFKTSLNHSSTPQKKNLYFLYSNTMMLVLTYISINWENVTQVDEKVLEVSSLYSYHHNHLKSPCSSLERHIIQPNLLESHQACHLPEIKV